ncbi:hypothetical protein GCM10028857_23580 [Salinarchaeum chitinilyticum]
MERRGARPASQTRVEVSTASVALWWPLAAERGRLLAGKRGRSLTGERKRPLRHTTAAFCAVDVGPRLTPDSPASDGRRIGL